jgi:hypothetical protein
VNRRQFLFKLKDLENKISRSKWVIRQSLTQLAIETEIHQIESFGKYGRKVKNVCIIAPKDIVQSSQKKANAEFICLIKNNLKLIENTFEKAILLDSSLEGGKEEE